MRRVASKRASKPASGFRFAGSVDRCLPCHMEPCSVGFLIGPAAMRATYRVDYITRIFDYLPLTVSDSTGSDNPERSPRGTQARSKSEPFSSFPPRPEWQLGMRDRNLDRVKSGSRHRLRRRPKSSSLSEIAGTAEPGDEP